MVTFVNASNIGRPLIYKGEGGCICTDSPESFHCATGLSFASFPSDMQLGNLSPLCIEPSKEELVNFRSVW